MSVNETDLLEPQPIEQPGISNLLMAVIGILSFFSVLGTVGNSLVLYVYVRKRNKLASTIFIITLACTDFFTCLIIIPYTMTLEYMRYRLKYDFLCKMYMFFITSNVPFSAFIMVAIAMDRYLCICHPFLHILNARRAKMTIIWLVVIAFTLGVITSLNYGVYTLQFVPDNSSLKERMYSLIQVNSSYVYDYFSGLHENENFTLTDLVPLDDNTHGQYMLIDTETCRPNGLLFSQDFTNAYQKIYSSFFVIVFIAVVILYIMIYKFVTLRRARRQRMRRQRSGYSSCREASFVLTRASISNGCVQTEVEGDAFTGVPRFRSDKSEITRQFTIREKGIVANIRTAGMLFVVTAVFIVVFLPAWLMAHKLIPYNMLIFYMYFFYNVANPMIYAFMNKAFRRDLRDLLECKTF